MAITGPALFVIMFGLLMAYGWYERRQVLARRLPDLIVTITADFSAMTEAMESVGRAARGAAQAFRDFDDAWLTTPENF